MKLGPVWLGLFCLWSLCHFWLLPLAKERWDAVDAQKKLAHIAGLVVLEKVRGLAAIGLLVLSAVIALIWVTTFLATTSAVIPQAVLATITWLYQATEKFSELFGTALGIIGLTGAVLALVWAARHARQKVVQAWTDAAQQILAKLLADPAALDVARADPEMEPRVKRIDYLAAILVAHDLGEPEKQLNSAEIDNIKGQILDVASDLSVDMARKQLHFADLIDKAAGDAPVPKGLWERLARVIASAKLTKDLGFVSKQFSRVISALLVVSLLGWSAEPMANSLRLAVNNLSVNILAKDVKQELDVALSNVAAVPASAPASTAPPPLASSGGVPIPHTAQSAARLIARVAIDEMVRNGVVERPKGPNGRPFSNDVEFVRAAINHQHIEVDTGSSADVVGKVRQEVAKSVAKQVDDSAIFSKATANIERELTPDLERLNDKNPGLFQKTISALDKRYDKPMAAFDAQSFLMEKFIGGVADLVDPLTGNEHVTKGLNFLKSIGMEALNTRLAAGAKAVLVEGITEGAKPKVHSRMNDFKFQVSPDLQQFFDKLKTAEGHGWADSPEYAKDSKMMAEVAEKVAARHDIRPERQAALQERLGGYDQSFPKDAPTNPSGPMDGSPPSGGGAGGPPPEFNNRKSAADTSSSRKGFAQSRATNFGMASRSFRVRGVLIGHDIVFTGVHVNGLKWTIQAPAAEKATQINLQVRQGETWRNLGLFDAGVVNQALRYASDRRVVATTITPGDDDVIGRITYLHPVLADTPLGCRIVEADRFIDTFTFPPKGIKPAAQLATLTSNRETMAHWTFVAGLTEAVATLPKLRSCPRDDLIKITEAVKTGAGQFSKALQFSLDKFISDEEKKQPQSTRVLSTANACASFESAKLVECLCDKAKVLDLPSRYWFPEDHTSQFRERQVVGLENWKWMQRSPDHLANIDLWVHTTFSLRKTEGDGAAPDDETASPVDFPEADLQALRLYASRELPRYLRDTLRSPNYDAFMAPIEDFILLQRLFRSSLAGSLGRDFPVGQLVRLERDTRKFVPSQPTIRWEPGMSGEELIHTLKSVPAAEKAYQEWSVDSRRRKAGKLPACDRVSL